MRHGDQRSVAQYVEEPMENEQSHGRCAALAWVGNKEDMLTVAKKIEEQQADRNDQFRRACLLEASCGARFRYRRRFGVAHPGSQSRPAPKQRIGSLVSTRTPRRCRDDGDDSLRNDAALALILGGSPDIAARAVAMYADKPKAALEELGEMWFRTFGYWSNDDLNSGLIFRWVDNAVAISHVEINQTAQEWATLLLMRQFDNLDFDNGPHSFTRPVLRVRLMQMARTTRRKRCRRRDPTLKFMNEQGILLALKDEGTAGRSRARPTSDHEPEGDHGRQGSELEAKKGRRCVALSNAA
jgi:hypothetical protein